MRSIRKLLSDANTIETYKEQFDMLIKELKIKLRNHKTNNEIYIIRTGSVGIYFGLANNTYDKISKWRIRVFVPHNIKRIIKIPDYVLDFHNIHNARKQDNINYKIRHSYNKYMTIYDNIIAVIDNFKGYKYTEANVKILKHVIIKMLNDAPIIIDKIELYYTTYQMIITWHNHSDASYTITKTFDLN